VHAWRVATWRLDTAVIGQALLFARPASWPPALVIGAIWWQATSMGDYPGSPAHQFGAAWQAATSALGQWRDQVSAATNEAIAKLDPAFRTAVEALRATLAGNWGACRCACESTHPQDKGVCDGDAILTRRIGDAQVPLCAPCAVAQGVAEMPRER
jgi:hypothetical protein